MGDAKCHGDHRSHLCALAGRGMVNNIKELVTKPEFMCGNCGRVADAGHRVCNPEPLGQEDGGKLKADG